MVYPEEVTRQLHVMAQIRESSPVIAITQQVLLMCVGNDNLHLITSDRRQRLRVDLADWEGNTTYAEYDNFTVGSAQEKYILSSLGTYNGTAGQ